MPKKADRLEKNEKKSPQAVKNKKKTALKIVLIVVLVLASLALLVWGLYHLAVEYYLGKINYETRETGLIFETQIIEESYTFEETGTETVDTPPPVTSDVNLPLIADTEDVFHVLLLATDARGNEAGLTDTMMLVSVNKKTGKIVLCSMLRDLYVTYPMDPPSPVAGKQAKLNHAHAYGGANLLMAVLKHSFNIDVNYYAKVNFYDFAKIVDAMGGLDVPLTSAEVDVINTFLVLHKEENEKLGVTEADFITNVGDGVYHLNGRQALHHARNRTIGNDFGRTQRQRQIIDLTLSKMGSLSLTQIMSFFDTVLPMVTTNMPKEMLKDMVGNVLTYAKYERVSTRVPQNGLYHEVKYNIIPDEKNFYMLYEEIYGVRAEGDPRDVAQESTAPSGS